MQFQGAMTALNGSQDIPWWCIALISSSQLTTVNSCASCLPPIDDGSFKCPQRCSWRAIPGAMTTLNGSNERLWRRLAMVWHPILSWELPFCMQAVYPNRWEIFQMSSMMQLTCYSRAVEGNFFFAYILSEHFGPPTLCSHLAPMLFWQGASYNTPQSHIALWIAEKYKFGCCKTFQWS